VCETDWTHFSNCHANINLRANRIGFECRHSGVTDRVNRPLIAGTFVFPGEAAPVAPQASSDRAQRAAAFSPKSQA
jgi:hypothetical protein